eukprot:12684366-Alexandrium_andersonii.AAC.1
MEPASSAGSARGGRSNLGLEPGLLGTEGTPSGGEQSAQVVASSSEGPSGLAMAPFGLHSGGCVRAASPFGDGEEERRHWAAKEPPDCAGAISG